LRRAAKEAAVDEVVAFDARESFGESRVGEAIE
jgi:hypothetical protein